MYYKLLALETVCKRHFHYTISLRMALPLFTYKQIILINSTGDRFEMRESYSIWDVLIIKIQSACENVFYLVMP